MLSYGRINYIILFHRYVFNSDRIMGIQMQISRETYINVIQMYLPSSNHSIVRFREHLEMLHDLISLYSQSDSSYVSFDNRCKSLSDHIIVSQELSCYKEYCKTLEDNSFNVSSHRLISRRAEARDFYF